MLANASTPAFVALVVLAIGPVSAISAEKAIADERKPELPQNRASPPPKGIKQGQEARKSPELSQHNAKKQKKQLDEKNLGLGCAQP